MSKGRQVVLSEKVNVRRIQGIIVIVYALVCVSFCFVPYTVAGVLAVFWYLGGIFYIRHLAYIKNRDRNGWTLWAIFNPLIPLLVLSMLKSLPSENNVE